MTYLGIYWKTPALPCLQRSGNTNITLISLKLKACLVTWNGNFHKCVLQRYWIPGLVIHYWVEASLVSTALWKFRKNQHLAAEGCARLGLFKQFLNYIINLKQVDDYKNSYQKLIPTDWQNKRYVSGGLFLLVGIFKWSWEIKRKGFTILCVFSPYFLDYLTREMLDGIVHCSCFLWLPAWYVINTSFAMKPAINILLGCSEESVLSTGNCHSSPDHCLQNFLQKKWITYVFLHPAQSSTSSQSGKLNIMNIHKDSPLHFSYLYLCASFRVFLNSTVLISL